MSKATESDYSHMCNPNKFRFKLNPNAETPQPFNGDYFFANAPTILKNTCKGSENKLSSYY